MGWEEIVQFISSQKPEIKREQQQSGEEQMGTAKQEIVQLTEKLKSEELTLNP